MPLWGFNMWLYTNHLSLQKGVNILNADFNGFTVAFPTAHYYESNQADLHPDTPPTSCRNCVPKLAMRKIVSETRDVVLLSPCWPPCQPTTPRILQRNPRERVQRNIWEAHKGSKDYTGQIHKYIFLTHTHTQSRSPLSLSIFPLSLTHTHKQKCTRLLWYIRLHAEGEIVNGLSGQVEAVNSSLSCPACVRVCVCVCVRLGVCTREIQVRQK